MYYITAIDSEGKEGIGRGGEIVLAGKRMSECMAFQVAISSSEYPMILTFRWMMEGEQ